MNATIQLITILLKTRIALIEQFICLSKNVSCHDTCEAFLKFIIAKIWRQSKCMLKQENVHTHTHTDTSKCGSETKGADVVMPEVKPLPVALASYRGTKS